MVHRPRVIVTNDHVMKRKRVDDDEDVVQSKAAKAERDQDVSSVKRALCSDDQCSNFAQKGGKCFQHGGGKRCEFVGCRKSSAGRGDKRFCITHGGGLRCTEPGCTKAMQGKMSIGKCFEHGGGYRCKEPGCKKAAQRKGLCQVHGGKHVCAFQGCTSRTFPRSSFCKTHGGSNEKKCSVTDCPKFCVTTEERRTGLCLDHGGTSRCSVLNCVNPKYGNSNFCQPHHQGPCQEPGCPQLAVVNGKCRRHGGTKPCSVDDCKNPRGRTGSPFCKVHDPRKCQHPNCPTPTLSHKEKFCRKHGGGPRCQAQGCIHAANVSGGLCRKHGGGPRCQFSGCSKGSSTTGDRRFCVEHGGGKRCEYKGCPSTAATFGIKEFCITHGGGKRCEGCGLFGSTDSKYKFCAYCRVGKVLHPKEREIVDLLKTKIVDVSIASHNKPVGGNACLKFRPDILYDRGHWAVIVEVDEDAHREYDRNCEQNRMKAIMETLSMRTVFLRYNPDPYKIDGVTMSTFRSIRHDKLLERVRFHLDHEPSELLTIEYLFYDQTSRVSESLSSNSSSSSSSSSALV